jgi:hypothetical protein
MEEASKSLGKLNEEQLKGLISDYNSGKEIAFDVKHVYELLFRDMMRQWAEDEPESKDDEGCGHDQNENYYGQED